VDITAPIQKYIEETFSPQDATDSAEDLATLAALRSEVVANAQGGEARRDTLLRYYRALCVVEARFPISKQKEHIPLAFTWRGSLDHARRLVHPPPSTL